MGRLRVCPSWVGKGFRGRDHLKARGDQGPRRLGDLWLGSLQLRSLHDIAQGSFHELHSILLIVGPQSGYTDKNHMVALQEVLGKDPCALSFLHVLVAPTVRRSFTLALQHMHPRLTIRRHPPPYIYIYIFQPQCAPIALKGPKARQMFNKP